MPGAIVYDRTKTVVRRHVAPGAAVPLHPEAAAFADHYGFAIDVLAAYRPTGKGRVERQVAIVRDHVIVGRVFDGLDELDAAFGAWLPIRRAQTHRTHGEVIAVRATRDRDRLLALPARPYLVADKHLRRVGKDCLVSFQASLYSVPARKIRAGQAVEVRAPRRWSPSTPSPATTSASRCWPPTGGPPGRQLGRRRGPLGRPARRPHPHHHPRAPRPGRSEPGARPAAREPLAVLLNRRRADRCRVARPCRLRHCRRTAPPTSKEHIDEPADHHPHPGHRRQARPTPIPPRSMSCSARAQDTKMGYLDFLDLPLEEELGERDGRRFRTALRLSGLPHHKTLDEFEFAFQPELDTRKVRDLATLSFVDAKSNTPSSGHPE